MVSLLLSVAIMAVALAVPHFSIMLNLLGGTTLALLCFIFPGLFYWRLSKKVAKLSSSDRESHSLSRRTIKSTPNHSVFGSEYDPILAPNEPLLDNTDQMNVSFLDKVLILLLCFVGIAAGFSSTLSVFASLINGDAQFTLPCFVNTTYGVD